MYNNSNNNVVITCLMLMIIVHYFTKEFDNRNFEKTIEKAFEKKTETSGNSIPIPLTGFKQIGILSNNTQEIILPLFGKSTLPTTYHLPYYYGEDTWNYYTISEKNNTMIPLEYQSNDCMTDTGCKELKTDDTIFISLYREHFKVKIYNI